jgi:hypothetical protein
MLSIIKVAFNVTFIVVAMGQLFGILAWPNSLIVPKTSVAFFLSCGGPLDLCAEEVVHIDG